jgi:hypothetical protein
MDANSKCGNCLYWERYRKNANEHSNLGRCHRHAPMHADKWIKTNEDDFCGDHSPGTPRIGKTQPSVGVM